MKIVLLYLSMAVLSSAPVYAGGLSVDDFLAEPDIFDVDLSPSGRYLAEVRRHEEVRIVMIRDLDVPGAPVIGQLGDSILRPYSVIWVSDERLLVHLLVPVNMKKVERDAKKKEDFDIDDYYMGSRTIAVNRNGEDAVMLLNDSWRLQSHLNLSRVSHILPNDPEHVLMTSFVGARPALFKVNVYDGSSETVIKGGRRTEGFLSDNNGNPLYRWDVVFRGKALFIYKLEDDGKWEQVETIEFDEEDEFGLVGLAKDGGLLYRKRNEETGYYEIIKRHKSEGRTEVLVSLPDRDVLSLIIDSQSDQVIGYRVEGDVIRNRYFDEELQAEYDNLKDRLMGYGFHFYSMSNKRRRSVIKSYGMDFPGSYFIYDHEKDELAFHANIYGGLRLVDLAVPATTTYLTRDKSQVRMYILLPPGYRQDQSYPMVMLVHGGPQARSYALYNNFAQFIATRGYIVVQPNFRGSTGYGLEFEKAGYKQLGRLMQDDLDDAVAFMVKKGMADESRVCIAGISYGGYAALMGLIKSPALYRCAISINGVTHLRDQVKFDEKRFSKWPVLIDGVHERIGDPKVDRKYMDVHSPLLRAGEIKSPLLLIAGERDEVVPFKQSRNLAKALKRAKAEFTFLPLEDVWHNVFYYREDREKVYKAVEDFLKKNL